jgi:RNA polymerase sigma-70 factor (ECF subfamily)
MEKDQLYREILKKNDTRIFRICSWYFTDTEERNDAYQESLIRIWEHLHTFRGESKVSTWIYRIVVNSCLTHIRKDKLRTNLIEPGIIPENIQVAETFPADDDQADIKLTFFRGLLQTMNHADRTLVSLYLEELSTKEMSDITGLTEANVRVKLHRIKEKIKKEWEDRQNGTG